MFDAIPVFKSDNPMINKAFRVAITDVIANVCPFKNGMLDEEKMCIIAGFGYTSPWTRDAAINTWNGTSLFISEETKNTLLSTLKKDDECVLIDGEYWDCIIWAIGAWQYYICTGDSEFLTLALVAIKNTLKHLEETEFDEMLNLFRGPACYGDGIAAYPDAYLGSGQSGIIEYVRDHPENLADKGVGIPMHVLSTNCLYYYAYKLVGSMSDELNLEHDFTYDEKAENMKIAINKHFWLEGQKTYRYIVDDFGDCDYQEGLGISFAILFEIADEEKIKNIFEKVKITPQGIACVWPSFSRYLLPDGTGYGRHSGTIWPHVEAFFADAACKCGYNKMFENELKLLAARAVRDGHFAEIYHPYSGFIYGGRQEQWGTGIINCDNIPKQTWSATGFLRLIFFNLFGMNITKDGITFNPTLALGVTEMSVENISYRGNMLNISVYCNSDNTEKIFINKNEHSGFFLPEGEGRQYNIDIFLKRNR